MTECKNPDFAQPPGPCPDDMTLAAFIDGNLRGEELRQVEAHLAACWDCALSVEELREDLTEPLEPIPPEESERFVAFAMAAVQRQWDARNEREAKAKRDRERARRASRLRRFAAVAACFVALLTISVVGRSFHVLRSDSVDRQKLAASTASRDGETSLPGAEAIGSVRLRGPRAARTIGMGEQEAYRGKQPASQELLADADVQKAIDEVVAQAEVDAMLPHTDAEYEAWAREEYPHIMWLYDVLTQPEYGIEWNGEPVNVPAWADRLYADLPAARRPRGWRALVVYSGEAFRFDYPTEPGQPNVMPRLAGVQLAAAVAGFEAEFAGMEKGDNGRAAMGANVPGGRPAKSGADKNGAAENGGAGDSAAATMAKRVPLPALTWAEHSEKALAMSAELARPAGAERVAAAAIATASNVTPVPAGYFAAASARPDTTQSILRFAAISDLVVGAPAATGLSQEAQALLLSLVPPCQTAKGIPSCTITLPRSTLESLFSARRELLANLAAQEGGSR